MQSKWHKRLIGFRRNVDRIGEIRENQYFKKTAMQEAAIRKARRGYENLIELPSDDDPSPSPTGTVFDPFPGPNKDPQDGFIR